MESMNESFIARRHLWYIILFDIFLFACSYIGAYLLRFDLKFPVSEYPHFKHILLPVLLLKFSVFFLFGLYKGMWRYTSIKDLENILKATLVSSSSIIVYILSVYRFQGVPRSVVFIDALLTIVFIGGVRLSIRLYYDYEKKIAFPWTKKENCVRKKNKKVIIIGAGDAGEKILREINDNIHLNYEVVGFLDDDKGKLHKQMHGVKVLGGIERIISLHKKISFDEIIIAIPSASGEKMRKIIDLCNKTGVKCKTLPGIGELIEEKVTISRIRNVSYEDLLGRSQIELEIEKIGGYLQGKSVLVTGAGGSIGSELCRQIAQFKPEIITMFDRAESSLYDIEMEMKRLYPNQDIVPVLGSVTCIGRVMRTFYHLEPQVVFHAAAYKHVPMMENNPWEAVYNNVLGTKNVLDIAQEIGAERFILVSTDKAVRPTNIMGATKRVAELLVQLIHRESRYKVIDLQGKPLRTKVMSVRFGNVVGSAGSVIPLFKKQIKHGGPVTVTHSEVIRYFMTISEAVQLILQAGAMGESGEIYILKMGQPVKIIDMAKDLIRLSGFEPDKDMHIEITGLRPGEKLYEELITEGEGIVSTSHDKLMVLRDKRCGGDGMTCGSLEKKIQEMIALADAHDIEGIKRKLKEIVPEYTPEHTMHTNEPFRSKRKGGDENPLSRMDAPYLRC